MKCDMCLSKEAEYLIKKSPPGSMEPAKEHHLCSDCASKYLKHDTVSLVRIARDSKVTPREGEGEK